MNTHKCTEFNSNCFLSLPSSTSGQCNPSLLHQTPRQRGTPFLATCMRLKCSTRRINTFCVSVSVWEHQASRACCSHGLRRQVQPVQISTAMQQNLKCCDGVFSRASWLGLHGPQSQSKCRAAATCVYSHQPA